MAVTVKGKLTRRQFSDFLLTSAPILYVSRRWSDKDDEEVFDVESNVSALDFFRKVEEESAREED